MVEPIQASVLAMEVRFPVGEEMKGKMTKRARSAMNGEEHKKERRRRCESGNGNLDRSLSFPF